MRSTCSTRSRKSSPAGRIQVCLTARIKFTGVPAETAGKISFEEIHSGTRDGIPCRLEGPARTICAALSSQLPAITVRLNRPVFPVEENTNEEVGKCERANSNFERERTKITSCIRNKERTKGLGGYQCY